MGQRIKGSDKTRLQALQELVKRIISVATRAVPDNPESPGEKLEGASLRFMNMDNEYTIRKLEDLSQVVFEATGGTPLGTKLHDRVLKPLIYDVLGTQKMLPRPLLIFTITDGLPDDDDMTVQEGITNCMKYLTDREQPKEGKCCLLTLLPSCSLYLRHLNSCELRYQSGWR